MADKKESDAGSKQINDDYDDKEATAGAYAALGIGFVCLLIGLPLWWKTTEIYRVSLPYNDIASLSSRTFQYSPNIKVIVFDEKVEKYDLAVFGESLKEAFESVKPLKDIDLQYNGNIRYATQKELLALQSVGTVKRLDRLLDNLVTAEENESYRCFILPANSKISSQDITLGLGRNVFLRNKSDLPSLVPKILKTTQETLVDESRLEKTFYDVSNIDMSHDDKESMRKLQSHPGYDVTFTLLNPEPAVINSQWEIESGIETYLEPLISQLSNYSDITVKSEILYYTSLPVKMRQDDKGHYLQLEDLPHLINPIEAKLGSHVSTNPAIHFITYLPSQKHSPLRILDSTTNAFFSPRWGGMMIYNIALANDSSLPALITVDVRTVMEVFIPQLKTLLGIHKETEKTSRISTDDSSIPVWQLDTWLRDRIIENIATSTATLKSLAQLLEKIRNIVINDEIGQQVVKAIECIKHCETSLLNGEVNAAYHYSQCAIQASEKAFFDPSLLELLYFPEDQKFAIYIPLFLPISIPVLLSLRQAVRWLYRRKK